MQYICSVLFLFFQITLADIMVAYMLNGPAAIGADSQLDAVPKIKALKQKVESSPKIAAWIAKRPQTNM